MLTPTTTDITRAAAIKEGNGYRYARWVDRAPRDDTRRAAITEGMGYDYARWVDKAPRDDTRQAALAEGRGYIYARFVDSRAGDAVTWHAATWMQALRDYAKDRQALTVAEVNAGAFRGQLDATRVAGLLKAAGWRKSRVRRDGHRVTVWIRADTPAPTRRLLDEQTAAPVVSDYLSGKQSVTVSDVLADAFRMPAERQGQADVMLVAGLLRSAGWQKTRVRRNGHRVTVWTSPREEG